MFWELDLFPSSGEDETPTVLGCLENETLITGLSMVSSFHETQQSISPPSHLGNETDPVSKKSSSLASKVQFPKSQALSLLKYSFQKVKVSRFFSTVSKKSSSLASKVQFPKSQALLLLNYSFQKVKLSCF
jgi:hypothetical protein